MGKLEDAIILSTDLHRNQVDRGGKPYILHCLTVMMDVYSMPEKIVAVLHDAIEDTPLQIKDLKSISYKGHSMSYENIIVEALEILTHEKKEDYETYILKCKKNKIARNVKIADLKHNLILARLNHVTKKDFERHHKYQRALNVLMEP